MKEDLNMTSDREELTEKRVIQTDQLKKFSNSTIKTSDVMPLSNATCNEFNMFLEILMALQDMGWYWH